MQVSEAIWSKGLAASKLPYLTNGLKKELYGTERVSLAKETEIATKEAQRIVGNPKALELLQSSFPGGFGPFARDVRAW
jgi:hypothetical protein